MEQKKPTAAQLQKRINQAIVYIDKTKNTRSVYFNDKGLRLIDCDDHVLVQTGFHTHVFNKVTSTGYSRPAMYISRMIDFALDNDCMLRDKKGNDLGYSYSKLFDTLKKKKNEGEENDEYNIAQYVDWYLTIIFAPLYAIDTNAASQFNVYMKYLNHIATQHIFLEEHKDGMTNKEFIEEYNKLMAQFLENITEAPIFEPLSDEQRMQAEIEALNEQEMEQQMENNSEAN